MYTGKHIEGTTLVKHTKCKKYYIIYHPLEKNVRTGNACVRPIDLLKYNKDFMFQYIGDDDKLKTIVVSRIHVKDHVFMFWKNVEDDYGRVRKVPSTSFYLIKLSKVFEYGEEVEL